MTKRKRVHDAPSGLKAVQHGQTQAIGPLFNVRHPKKKTARSADTTTDGKETPHSS